MTAVLQEQLFLLTDYRITSLMASSLYIVGKINAPGRVFLRLAGVSFDLCPTTSMSHVDATLSPTPLSP